VSVKRKKKKAREKSVPKPPPMGETIQLNQEVKRHQWGESEVLGEVDTEKGGKRARKERDGKESSKKKTDPNEGRQRNHSHEQKESWARMRKKKKHRAAKKTKPTEKKPIIPTNRRQNQREFQNKK